MDRAVTARHAGTDRPHDRGSLRDGRLGRRRARCRRPWLRPDAPSKVFSKTSVEARIALIDRIIAAYERRESELAQLIAQEVGVPVSFHAQVSGPAGHMKVARDVLRSYAFERRLADTIVRREPIGVCALISPWNWPIQTSVIKVIYAIAAGCTMVLKPSDASPASGVALAEIMDEADTPPGVFNLVTGKGSVVGEALSAHPEVDMISFTGSTAAGIRVGEAAARRSSASVLNWAESRPTSC